MTDPTLKDIWDLLQEIKASIKSPVPAPTREFAEWNAKRVRGYKVVDDLLRDMAADKFDVNLFKAYGEQEKAQGRRLTTAKIADKFFTKSAKVRVVSEKPVDIQPERRKTKNVDFLTVYERMKSMGWDEDYFSRSIYKNKFSSFLDFCGFAPEHIIDQCNTRSQK